MNKKRTIINNTFIKKNSFKVLFSLILIILNQEIIYAQQSDTLSVFIPTNNATLVGIGNSNLYDTYLSPLEYKGKSFRLINERMKQMPWLNNQFTRQQTIEIEFSNGKNPVGNAQQYWLLLNYNWGGHYNLFRTNKFRLAGGAIWSIAGGILYNERNSNNPASARAYSNINLSAIAFYSWKSVTFRWQLNSPVAGILFSPHFGQSYYEISLGNTVGTAHFASLHNQLALRNYITADIPISKFTLRIGYLGSYYQTEVSNLNTHTYSNSMLVGLVYESINLGGNKIKKNRQIKSSYYFE